MTVVRRQSAIRNQLPVVSINRKFVRNRQAPDARRLQADDCPVRTDTGIILIALLWILIALSGIALSFSREGYVEIAAARNTQALEDSYFVARAGISTAIYKLMEKQLVPTVRRLQLQETPDSIDLGTVNGSFEDGVYRVDIQDESGKINLNTVASEQLHALAEVLEIPKGDADVIVDSIQDWRDADNLFRFNGAEDDYYQSLNPPYKPKNGRFDTVEELLLIKGITPAYFYGYPEKAIDESVVYKYGLSRYLTVYSNRNQINVNYAPLPVLRSVPGMPAEAAKWLYEHRLVKPFNNMLEITSEIPIKLEPQIMSFLTTERANIFTLTASARAGQSKARRVIRTVISLQRGGSSAPYQTLYWNENVPDYESVTP